MKRVLGAGADLVLTDSNRRRARRWSTVREVTGIDFEPGVQDRRPGDPARIVASGELAARDIGWEMSHDLASMVRSAWEARQAATADPAR